ncbi:MAG: hypothetical protein RDU20_09460 [Desulfomonilaceae bacterium]|nr:hypothetical protein [Desulfomonilaceae bacterium]
MNERGAEPLLNPFVAVAVGDPLNSKVPDVQEVNKEAFEGMVNLLTAIERTPNMAALVLGEAGSGKTHLIRRLVSLQGDDLVFVYVHPMKDHRRLFSSLLQIIIAALEYPPPGSSQASSLSQLEILAAHVMVAAFEDYLGNHPDDGGRPYLGTVKRHPFKILGFRKFSKWDSLVNRTVSFLSRHASLQGHSAKRILRVLFQYLDESKREAAATYLSGSDPDDEGAGLLGVKLREGDFTVEAREDRSKEILKTLGKLLKYYRPMILCFDQLENLNTDQLIGSFGRLINDIVNEVDNVLPVGFVRAETWDMRMAPSLDGAAKGRLSSNVFHLKGLSLDQAIEIVRARLSWAYTGTSYPRPDDFHPFQRAVLEKRLLGLTSPRDVLVEANRMFQEVTQEIVRIVPEDPLRILLHSFETEREGVLADTKQPPARKDVLVAALNLLFRCRDRGKGYQVLAVDSEGPVDLKIRIAAGGAESPIQTVDLLVETANHWNPLQRSLNLLRERIEANLSQVAVLVRDARQKIPPKKGGMPKTVKAREALEAAGGQVLYLEYRHLADLYALVYTSDKIGSGDLTYTADSTGERRPVDKAIFHSFVREHFQGEFLAKIDQALVGGHSDTS